MMVIWTRVTNSRNAEKRINLKDYIEKDSNIETQKDRQTETRENMQDLL